MNRLELHKTSAKIWCFDEIGLMTYQTRSSSAKILYDRIVNVYQQRIEATWYHKYSSQLMYDCLYAYSTIITLQCSETMPAPYASRALFLRLL